jgi:hypothetical protein
MAELLNGIDEDSGEIVAFDLPDQDVDDALHAATLLDQLTDAPASLILVEALL